MLPNTFPQAGVNPHRTQKQSHGAAAMFIDIATRMGVAYIGAILVLAGVMQFIA